MKKGIIKEINLVKLIQIVFQSAPYVNLFRLVCVVLRSSVPVLQLIVMSELIGCIQRIHTENSKVYIWFFALLLLFILQEVFSFLSENAKIIIHKKLSVLLQEKLVKKIAGLEYCDTESENIWKQRQRLAGNMVQNFENGYDNLLKICSVAYQIITLFLFITRYVWYVGVLLCATAFPMFLWSVKQGRKNYHNYCKSENERRYADYLNSLLTDRKSLYERVMFQYKEKVQKKWQEKDASARKIENKVLVQMILKMKAGNIFNLAIAVTAIFVFAEKLYQHELEIGVFMSLANGTLSFVSLMSWSFVQHLADISRDTKFIDDWVEVMSLPEQAEALSSAGKLLQIESIEFIDVSFCYPETEQFVLKHFNAKFLKNKCYAIVGENGSGKSTVIKLLLGLYQNYEGKILINRRDISTYSYADLKRTFSVVNQDFVRYPLSVRENIELRAGKSTREVGKSGRDCKEFIQILKDIKLEEFIKKLPKGLDTELGKLEKGSIDVSGGEWQKIVIAGTLYSDAELKILDEPTAALSPLAETQIYELFEKSVLGMSVLITHRMGATRIADEILVIHEGTVAEQGNFKNLCRKKGMFWRMYDKQRKWYIE